MCKFYDHFVGEIGDWKNYLTVALNEEFDKALNKQMKNVQLDFELDLYVLHFTC